jgi:hypothetical protein
MKKPAPTLADAFLRESHKPYYTKIDPGRKLPWMVANARRFVLDDDMSAFMADLAWASLLTCKSAHSAQILLDGMRSLARLPHKITWIEYNGKAKTNRARAEYGSPVDPALTPERLGWLCWQHESIETAFGALEFASHVCDGKNAEPTLNAPQAFPFAYAWRSDDGPLPWTVSDIQLRGSKLGVVSMPAALTGISSYRSDYVSAISSPAGGASLDIQVERGQFDLSSEVAGDLRYLWALLATIGDLPVQFTDVRASKGYIARGRYRKFMDHRTITLKIPAARYKRVAAQAIAISRRRAHEVRGHWRKDYRRPGQRLWIKEHVRGDAALGWVSHDYTVTRNKKEDDHVSLRGVL